MKKQRKEYVTKNNPSTDGNWTFNDHLQAEVDLLRTGFTVSASALGGAMLGEELGKRNPKNKRHLVKAEQAKKLSNNKMVSPYTEHRAFSKKMAHTKRYDRLIESSKMRGARGGMLGGLVLSAGLQANELWGRHLDRPQKVSSREVDSYIQEAKVKGIYKPRKKN